MCATFTRADAHLEEDIVTSDTGICDTNSRGQKHLYEWKNMVFSSDMDFDDYLEELLA